MKAYYGSRISPNQTETPEGYLVAHNVPISRTGYQEYLGNEIGLNTDDRVKVYRDPDEVFSPHTMASFEGKSVTNNHPPVGLDADNTHDYEMGHVTNVRRGKDGDSDLLLADLIIKDQRLIDAIRNGKREVSAGYECDYVPNDNGTYSHRNIVGNHVAVVDQGRAGHRVRIMDRNGVNNAMDDDQLDKEAEEASKKYGITVKKDGHKTPPEGYPKDREQYGDPVNYKYPLDDHDHVQAAVDYFDKKKDHSGGDYNDKEWEIIGKRVAKAANRVLHSGYEYRDGNIVDTKQKAQDSKGGIRMKFRSLPTLDELKKGFQAWGFKHWVQDSEPDEIAEVWDAMEESAREEAERSKTDNGSKETNDDDEDQEKLKELLAKVDALEKELAEVKASKTQDEKTAEQMLDEEISKTGDPEETGTIEPEEMTGDELESGAVTPPDDRPENPITADSASALRRAILRELKPVIAAIPDEPTRRKVVTDTLARLQGRSGQNIYGQMARDTRDRVQQQRNQKQDNVVDIAGLGQRIRDQYNPHYKNRQA